MNTDEAGGDRQSAGEQTAVLPETAAQLVELERLQLALGEAEERAKNHWEPVSAGGRRSRQRPQAGAAGYRGGQPLRAGEIRRGAAAGPGQPGAGRAERREGRPIRSLKQGQEATLQLLAKALEKIGIVTINPVGEPFDPARHEAMMAQPSNTAEPNSVLQVVQPGYELNGRLLRPARVIVSKAP